MRDTRTLGLPPEPKADAQPLSHPGAPRSFMFNVIFDMVRFSSRLFFLRERERERAHVNGGRGIGKERESSLPVQSQMQGSISQSHNPEITT